MKTNILVFSDAHNRNRTIIEAIKSHPEADTLIFLGDGERDFENALAECDLYSDNGEEKVNVFQVSGNCDWMSTRPTHIIADLGGIKTLITHGHGEGVKSGYGRLYQLAREKECRLVLYGHTHFQTVEKNGDIMLLNPGAVNSGEYAVITIEDGVIDYRLES